MAGTLLKIVTKSKVSIFLDTSLRSHQVHNLPAQHHAKHTHKHISNHNRPAILVLRESAVLAS